jgi:hypothetical protein
VNRSLLHWQIGRDILEKQQKERWGSAAKPCQLLFLDQLCADPRELARGPGFSFG